MRSSRSTPLPALRLLCVAAALLTAPAALAEVRVDWDRSAAFGAHATFSLGEGTPLSNPLASQRIEQELGAMLLEKGVRQDAAADLLVIVHASVEPARILNLAAYKDRSGIWETRAPEIRSIDAGTLMVDFLDATTGRLIWRGIATDTVTNNPTRNEKSVPKALRRMLKKFPPPVTKQSVPGS
jgi:hypothetical protein